MIWQVGDDRRLKASVFVLCLFCVCTVSGSNPHPGLSKVPGYVGFTEKGLNTWLAMLRG